MNGRRRARARAIGWPVAAALCALALFAVWITVPHLITSWRTVAAPPLAPGLAALSGQQLTEMMPKQGDFPDGWTPTHGLGARPDGFGYSRYHPIGAAYGHEPAECFDVAYGGSAGAIAAADIAEHDPADPPYSYPGHADIRVEIGREFAPAVFDEMTARVSRCLDSVERAPPTRYAVRILEDSRDSRDVRRADETQRFRYAATSSYSEANGEGSVHIIGTSYHYYARVSGVVLTATASEERQQQILDSLFEATLRRIQAAR